MNKRQRATELPSEAISIKTYKELALYVDKLATGELGLVLLLGRPGTGKSESVKHALGFFSKANCVDGLRNRPALYVEGHMQPFGLYRQLWEHRNLPVVLDDLDKLYANADCVRLLKPLCNTGESKRVSWLTNVTMNSDDLPPAFTTTSNVILIANEWKTVNSNVRALEDRAIILHFDPSNAEVHQRVGQWFQDREVYLFIERILPCIRSVSMRHYCKASQLRRAGLLDWQDSLLQMVIPNRNSACVARLQIEPKLRSERERVEHFIKATGNSRATYFRAKARLKVPR
jgi:energy-coupling factor transporter ATP-binding protein EcfA2